MMQKINSAQMNDFAAGLYIITVACDISQSQS